MAETGELAGLRARVAELEEQLGLLRSTNTLGLWRLDLATRTASWDAGMIAIFGTTASATMEGYIELVHPEDRQLIEGTMAATMTTGTWHSAPHRIVRKSDGALRWVVVGGRFIDGPGGAPTSLVGFALDITEQRALAEEVARGRRLAAVGSLASGVAHNFNNMLAVVVPALELVRESVDPSLRETVDLARQATDRAATLIRQLLRFVRATPAAPTEPTDVAAAIRSAVALCKGTFERRAKVAVELPSEPLPGVIADAGELEQVLVNLLVNAFDASAGEPIAIRVTAELTAMPVAARAAAKQAVRVDVADDGPGMTPEVATRVFEPFFTTKPVGRGTGLGLSTAFQFATDAGGWLSVETAPSAGATFSLHLPVAETPASTAIPAKKPRALEGRVVLLIDDEPGVRAIVGRLLEQLGAHVRRAEDGRAGVASARLSPAPDVILLDRSMPHGSGDLFIDDLRVAAPHARLLLFSGQTIEPELQARVDGVLAKPVGADELVEAIRHRP
jgi:two-component system, cell cycle sensor histidine kinase and response regulator CckA